jgi:predicted PurR-regulated permease PerM
VRAAGNGGAFSRATGKGPVMAAVKDKDLISVTGRSPALTAAKATAGVLIVMALVLALWFARVPVLLAFAGLLLSIVLYGASRWLAEKTGLPRLPFLAVVVVGFIGLLVLVVWQAGPTLAQQATELTKSATTGLTALTKEAVTMANQRDLLEDVNLMEVLSQLSPWSIATGATAFAGSVLGVFTAGLIILFFGIYLAADPDTYVNLLARLAPEERRHATYEMLFEVGEILRRWLIGQGLAMVAIGTITYVGLLILGVPLPFLLAIFAALAGFLPYLGPIIGAVPIVLVAGGDSLTLALYAIGLYVIVQFVESYLLTPLIQAKAVSLPPVIVILSQLVLGSVLGLLGIALATPLVAAATVPLRHVFGPPKTPPAKHRVED